MPDQEYFQEANTTFEKDGRMYRIVKQRYHKDTLQIIYVPDQGKQNLKQLIKAWVTAQSGEDTSSDGIAQLKPIFKPYIQDESGVLLSLGTSSVVNETPCCTPIFPSSVHHSRLSPPPEIMC